MKELIDGTKIPDKIYYTVLDYYDDDRTDIEGDTGAKAVSKMNFDQFHKAFGLMFNHWCGIMNNINQEVNKDSLVKTIKPSSIDVSRPFLGSEWKKIEREHNARILVTQAFQNGNTFDQDLPKSTIENEPDYGLNKDYSGNIECVIVNDDGTVRVTDEFVRRVLKYKKS